jgi:hypothetical protein
VKPTFIGIGAQKCASTWIYQILRDHPRIGVSEHKEIDFFSYRFDAGYQWYERRFEHCSGRPAFGEVSPSYFHEPAVPGRVAAYAPDAKIIVSLRDPVERALSNHRHEVRLGRFSGPDMSFEAGLANNPGYEEQGRYATHLGRWLECFDRDRILVLFHEDIERSPMDAAARVYEFLGVDPGHVPASLAERPNRSHATRYGWLTALKDGVYQRPWLRSAWGLGVTMGLRSVYRTANVLPSERVIPPPGREVLATLRARLAPEIRGLSALTGRPLDHWLTC